MTPTKRFLFLLLFTGIGIIFGICFGIAFYFIRKKKDKEIKLSGSINEIITPSISFWVTIGILIILKCEYGISLQLFIISGIILASFLSAISIKKAWLFFLGLGVVITELGLGALIRRIVEWINCTMDKKKAAIIANIPEPSAPPMNNASLPNAPPINNAPLPNAPPINKPE